MEVATLTLAIIAAFLSVCAFVASAVTAVVVIGWSKSTHKIVSVAAEPTRFGYDLPPEFSPATQLAEEALTPEAKEYVRRQREAALGDDFDE